MTEEVTEKTITGEDTMKAAPKSRSGGLWLGIIVLLMGVLVAGAGFFLYQQLKSQGDDINKEDQRNIEMAKQISGFQSQLAAMQTQLTEATGSISNADARFEDKLLAQSKTQEEKLETTRKELTTAVVQIQRQLGKTRGDWLIADAEYLLSVAGQRLHLIGDIETTREALEAADQRLRESGDAGAIKVREEIAKELASLRSVPAIDLVGLYSKLQSLSERVNQLTLFLPYEGKQAVKSSEHDKHPASSETSSDILNAALKTLDAYVTVRHTKQPIKEILTAEQAQFIRQQLSLKLEMIKVALVQKNQTLYHASLTDALDWLDKHFNKNAETQGFIAELQQLDTVKLNAQMPDISGSLKMLRDITKLRIETDKALPVVDLESKLERPKKVEEKPAVAETPVAAPKPSTETAAPEVKTEKPVVNTSPNNATTSNAASTAEKPATAPAAEVTPKVPETKKAEPATVPVAQPAVEVKKASDITAAEKGATTTEPAAQTPDKNPPPAVIKPVVVH